MENGEIEIYGKCDWDDVLWRSPGEGTDFIKIPIPEWRPYSSLLGHVSLPNGLEAWLFKEFTYTSQYNLNLFRFVYAEAFDIKSTAKTGAGPFYRGITTRSLGVTDFYINKKEQIWFAHGKQTWNKETPYMNDTIVDTIINRAPNLEYGIYGFSPVKTIKNFNPNVLVSNNKERIVISGRKIIPSDYQYCIIESIDNGINWNSRCLDPSLRVDGNGGLANLPDGTFLVAGTIKSEIGNTYWQIHQTKDFKKFILVDQLQL